MLAKALADVATHCPKAVDATFLELLQGHVSSREVNVCLVYRTVLPTVHLLELWTACVLTQQPEGWLAVCSPSTL